MGMSPSEFFSVFVEENCFACENAPGSVRDAFNAAVSASHLADHYFNFNKRNDPKRVEQFKGIGDFVAHLEEQTNGTFRDIRSIANAYKHLYTDINPRHEPYASVSSAGAVEAIEFPTVEEIDSLVEDYEREIGSKVIYRRKDGSSMEFLPTLKTVQLYWYELFRKELDH